MQEISLAWRLLGRDYRAGELTLIAAAIVIAVAAVTTVGFFTDRVQQALGRQANQLLGADLVIADSRPLAPELKTKRARRGLVGRSRSRVSQHGRSGRAQPARRRESRQPGFPLRGSCGSRSALRPRPARRRGSPSRGRRGWTSGSIPASSSAGSDRVSVGRSGLHVTAIITHEPESRSVS